MKEKIVIILHYDWDEYIQDRLDINEISSWAINNGYRIIEVFHDQQVTNFEGIKDTDVCDWLTGYEDWFNNPAHKFSSKYFKNADIILTGGFRSQCLQWVFLNLKESNNIKINPDWVVDEPWYVSLLTPAWQFPETVILKCG